MTSSATTLEEYIQEASVERLEALKKLRTTISDNLPEGFEEGMSYGMINYYVPHSLYPAGYHCKPKNPLPFMSFASQKNSVNLYHSGIYAEKELFKWFVEEYPKHVKTKLDMGKSCIRFKKVGDIPYELIAELVQKMTVKEWISIYEKNVKR